MPGRVGRLLLVIAVALLVLVVAGRAAVGFYTEVLWQAELGYLSTYWRRLGFGLGVRGGAALLAAGLVLFNLWLVSRHLGPVRVRRRYGNIEIAEAIPRRLITAAVVLTAVLSGWWLAELQFDQRTALGVVAWLRHVEFGLIEPLHGRDVAFYVFHLPVRLQLLDFLIVATVWSMALVAVGHVLVGGIQWQENQVVLNRPARLHLAALVAAMILLLGIRYWLGRYLLVVDGNGVGGGLGYTDVRARLPAYWILALLSLGAGAAVVYGAWRNWLLPPVVGLGLLLFGMGAAGLVYPAVVQKFQVEPNELRREAPFIRWNMDFTLRAYGLDGIERRRFPYRGGAAPGRTRLELLTARLPLWEGDPLRRAFNETQTLFQYYRFHDVDFDRYGTPGDERQVAIGVREFFPEGLPQASRTWQSLRLNPEYIRGKGVVVAATHTAAARQATPRLWVRNLNPVLTDPEAPPGLELLNPDIFYGETMTGHAIVVPGRDGAFTGQPGVDFPAGVPLTSYGRVVAFAWRFGDETLLFSSEVTRDSRMIFRRAVGERVQALAPFLVWDGDALPVVSRGRVVWMLDGYTVSSSFPMARAVNIDRRRVRYLRNSVKAVVDAVTGAVDLYVIDETDPIIATYRRVFPELFRDRAGMPESLRLHLRYPELVFLAQSEILQEYHVERVETFYAGQDVWQRPQEVGPGGGIRDFRPIHALVPEPMDGRLAYLAILPFIARARQNMTAVLLARNDYERYGDLVLLEFPRDQQITGPGQIQAMVEQDPVIARELSLLRQRGSAVDMGRLRVLPLDSTVMYVQPLFLSADENPIPELWGVVVSEGRGVSLASTLPGALAGLDLPIEADAPPALLQRASNRWSARALELLDHAEGRLREGDWAGYGRALGELRTLLQRADGEPAAGSGG